MTSSADIVNRALQFTGGYNDQNPVTGAPPSFDGTPTGLAAGALYNACVQTIARQFGWDFNRNIFTLSLTPDGAPVGYAYQYFYPATTSQIRQLRPATDVDVYNPLPQLWTVANSSGPFTAATGYLQYNGLPAVNDTITLNGITFTYVAGSPGAGQLRIQGTVAGQVSFDSSVLAGSVVPQLSVASYSSNTNQILITYKTLGTGGNGYGISASSANIVPSGTTLTGGSNALRKVILTNLVSAIAVITNSPSEDTWDPIFTEAVVRLLASELDLAIDGKPESSQLTFQQFGGFEKAGEDRTDS